MGVLTKHSAVFIETMDIHSKNPGLASQQLKEGRMAKAKVSTIALVFEVPKLGVVACPTPAEELMSQCK